MIAYNVSITWTTTQHPGKNTFHISVGFTGFSSKSTTSISLLMIQFLVMMPSPYGKYGTCIMDLKWGTTFAILFMLIQLQILHHLITYWWYFSPRISMMSLTGLWWISKVVVSPLECRLSWYCNSCYASKTARSEQCSFCHHPLLPCSLSLQRFPFWEMLQSIQETKLLVEHYLCMPTQLSLHSHREVKCQFQLQLWKLLVLVPIIILLDSTLTVSDHVPYSSLKLTPVNDW